MFPQKRRTPCVTLKAILWSSESQRTGADHRDQCINSFTSVPSAPLRKGGGRVSSALDIITPHWSHSSSLSSMSLLQTVQAISCHTTFSLNTPFLVLFVEQFDAPIVLKVSWGVYRIVSHYNLQHQVRREVRSQVNISSSPGPTLALQWRQGNSKVTRFPPLWLNSKYNC